MKKRGISLIVLVITIIVIVVLATAVIVSLTRNNPVENAKEATFKSDLSNIKDLVNLASTDILLEKEGASYEGIIPAEYEEKLEIHKGVLYYKGEPGQEEEWAKEIGVIRKEFLPDDWIDISKSTPGNGINLLIGKPELEEATIKFKVTISKPTTYSVDWGDGSSASYGSEAEASHTYSTNSDKSSTDGYLFEVKITPDSGGDITKFEHTQETNSPLLWCEIGCDTLTTGNSMFLYASRLKKVGTAKETSLSQVKNMWGMFTECSNLTSIPYFDTSSVTNMGWMFRGCSSLTTIPKMDTSQATNTQYMFYGCSSLKEIPLLDTRKVTDMTYMFRGCSSLTDIPLLDTSNVTYMQGMFYGCSSLKEIPELDTSNVTYMPSMFEACSSLEKIPELDTSKVTNMHQMFSYCSSLTTIPELDTRNVTSMGNMFWKCSSLKSIPLLDTSKVTSMVYMFKECSSLKSISIANTNLTNTQIDNVFNELPTSIKNAIIDITGNPGESSCTRSTATGKGWTVIP